MTSGYRKSAGLNVIQKTGIPLATIRAFKRNLNQKHRAYE